MRLNETIIIAVGMTCLVGCGTSGEPEDRTRFKDVSKQGRAPVYQYKETVNLPYDHLGMNTGKRDVRGKPVRVRCATCHRLLKPEPENKLAKSLKSFHTGVKVKHGDLTCGTCHNPPLFETFRLGSGAAVSYGKVMSLCGQCHGRQRKDYRRGIHGGMAGHWDLNAGPRDRNHCLDCHNPHRPAHDRVVPAPRPRYRFLDQGGKGGGHE